MAFETDYKRKITDINAIEFGDTVEDISASLLIITTLYEIDDNQEVIKASRAKLQEGINKLIELGAEDQAEEFMDGE